jgi:DNA primase
MLIYKEGKNFHNSEDISNYINEVIKELHLVKDKVVREVVIQKLSKETGVMPETLLSLLSKEEKIDKPAIVIFPKKEAAMQSKYQKACERIIFYMLHYKEVIRLFNESSVFIPIQEYRYLACEIVSFYTKYQCISIADFMAYLGDKKELADTLSKVLILPLPETYIGEEIEDYIDVLNACTVEMEIKRLQNVFQSSSDGDKAHIANQIMELRKGVNTNGTD